MIRIGISGAAGRMGQNLIEACCETSGVVVGAAIERPGSPAIGRDAGELAGLDRLGVTVGSDLAAAVSAIDVLIDFTAPAATLANLRVCRDQRLRMVIGTTGFAAAERAEIAAAARDIAIVQSPNMSIGVNLCFKLTQLAAEIMGKGSDIGIVETHHLHKQDAPSGTAVHLGEIIARVLKLDLNSAAVYGKDGGQAQGDAQRIRFESIREGEVVGDHSVSFAVPGERVEITHHASSRRTFAAGAVRAAQWLLQKDRGLYDMQDVLGLR